jgi:hypothetical protein
METAAKAQNGENQGRIAYGFSYTYSFSNVMYDLRRELGLIFVIRHCQKYRSLLFSLFISELIPFRLLLHPLDLLVCGRRGLAAVLLDDGARGQEAQVQNPEAAQPPEALSRLREDAAGESIPSIVS